MPVVEFFDYDDPTSRTRARSYVAKKAVRDKRLRQIDAYQRGLREAPKAQQCADSTATRAPDTPDTLNLKQALPPPHRIKPESTRKPPDSEADPDQDVPAIERPGEQDVLDTYASRVAARPHGSFWTVYSQLSAGDRNLLQWCKLAPYEENVGRADIARKTSSPCLNLALASQTLHP
jgi:hypothetical protein